jgi:hypothetical protein
MPDDRDDAIETDEPSFDEEAALVDASAEHLIESEEEAAEPVFEVEAKEDDDAAEEETQAADAEATEDSPAEDLPPEAPDELTRQRDGLLREVAAMRQERAHERAALEAKLDRINEALDARREPEEDDDPETNPVGHLDRQNQEIQAQLGSIQQQQAAQQISAVQNHYAQQLGALEAQTREKHPDLDDAINFVRQQRVAMIRRTQRVPESEIPQKLNEADVAFMDTFFDPRSMAFAKNPADEYYAMALEMGYKPAEPEPNGDEPEGESETKPPDEVISKRARQLEERERRQATAKNLGQSGRHRRAALTLDNVMDLDDDEIDRLIDNPALLEKLEIEGELPVRTVRK